MKTIVFLTIIQYIVSIYISLDNKQKDQCFYRTLEID